MPLPAALVPLLHQPRFWSDYLWMSRVEAGTPYPARDALAVEMPVGGGFRLRLDFDVGDDVGQVRYARRAASA